VTAGSSYLVEQPSSLTTSLPFAQVTGSQATTAKHLGSVSIGLDGNAPPPVGGSSYANLAASFNDVGITADTDTAPGNFDGGDASFSETALTNAGAGPGASITSSGVTFTFPDVAAGSNDNTVAEGQTIDMPGRPLAAGTSAIHVFALGATGGGEAPYPGAAAAIPGAVQAANYDTGGQGAGYNVTSVNGTDTSYRPDAVDLEACTDSGAAAFS
jgi:hypothetical protein